MSFVVVILVANKALRGLLVWEVNHNAVCGLHLLVKLVECYKPIQTLICSHCLHLLYLHKLYCSCCGDGKNNKKTYVIVFSLLYVLLVVPGVRIVK